MRWVAFGSSEYAFLSIGAAARGVIAIGGMAHGVIAIGAFVSVGVVSIGMNAVGSVAAFGMNAVAPISISLINALGIYVLAGVNGCGTWTSAGTNATGLAAAQGGVNNDKSLFPTIVMLIAWVVLSSIFRGTRAPRSSQQFPPLRRFLKSKMRQQAVRAELVEVRPDGVVLADGDETVSVRCEDPKVRAELPEAGKNVLVVLERFEETVLVEGSEVDYRSRPSEQTQTLLRVKAILPNVEPKSWLPESTEEVQWVIAWSARIAAAVTVALLVKWMR